MVQGPELLLHLQLRCDADAPRVVRAALAEVAPHACESGDVMLVASELVTNAVVHSGCDAHEQLDVELLYEDDQLVISVRDPGTSGQQASIAEERAPGLGGLGLRIVDQVALSWGRQDGDGYRVWAVLPVPAVLH